ncbi:hypothetical protein GRF61_10705 [Azoarcus sp. TTM-91]|uniref:hypothetical protein n=1 Tax=Azoarcus sp. TTM-91 TaxID=2691581 RepID=UPI00145D6052|nr:hypothetical protein [Azoarcus sp. TTM-91]NMG34909.1 hypothetical protein [Azoarcus sp. TTM-91]
MKIRKLALPAAQSARGNTDQLDNEVVGAFLQASSTALDVATPAKPRKRSKKADGSESSRSGALALAATLLGITLAAPAPAIAARNNHYPLIVTPLQSSAGGQEEIEQVRVGIFDTAGQRLLHAQVHGRSKLGALPPGEYTVEVSSAAGSTTHQVKLGPGQRGIVRYGGQQAAQAQA